MLTTSERGTLLRVWDSRGTLERELRRGVDRADMWNVKFEAEVMEGDKARKGGMAVGYVRLSRHGFFVVAECGVVRTDLIWSDA